jgi:glycosyltransferase involved in cell wall biosynthesis
LNEVARLKRHYTPHGEHLVGHFGTFGAMITDILMPTISRFLRESPRETALLVGRGGLRFRERFAAAEPGIAKRVHAVGELSAPDAVNHLLACDLVVQPYPDGVTSRRTSVMAALAHGLPVVTNLGFLSESLWQDHVATAPAPNPVLLADSITRLLNNIEEREELGRRGLRLYRDRFAVARSIARLRGYERE